MLQMRPVAWRIPVDSPELFDFLLGQHLAIVRAEQADLLASRNLQQKTAFGVDVIGCHALRGGYKDIDLLVAHVALKFMSADFENVGHAVRKQLGIGRIMFGALDGNSGASRLDAPDRLIDREAGWGGSPALVKVGNTRIVIDIVRLGKRGIPGKLDDPRQRKERISAWPVAENKISLIEILPEFVAIYQKQGLAALAYGLRRYIRNARHLPLISICGLSKSKTQFRINWGVLNDNQIPVFSLGREVI